MGHPLGLVGICFIFELNRNYYELLDTGHLFTKGSQGEEVHWETKKDMVDRCGRGFEELRNLNMEKTCPG